MDLELPAAGAGRRRQAAARGGERCAGAAGAPPTAAAAGRAALSVAMEFSLWRAIGGVQERNSYSNMALTWVF